MPEARGWALRVATPEDAEQVSALLDRSYSTAWASFYEADLIAAVRPFVTRANPKLLASGTYFVVTAPDGLAVGCGGWTHEAPGTGALADGVAHIRHFATDPGWLRLGIAGAMLRRCIEEAEAAGATALFADSARGAEPFYAAFGFETMREIVPAAVRAFERLRRVEVRWPPSFDPMPYATLADDVARIGHRQPLAAPASHHRLRERMGRCRLQAGGETQ